MGVPIDDKAALNGPYRELIRLQAEFLSRLEAESLNYVRGLHEAVGTVVPGTILLPGASLEYRAYGVAGSPAHIHLELDNRNEIPCIVFPMVSPMLEASGVVWFPSIRASHLAQLVAPNDSVDVTLTVPLPPDLPSGAYRGAIILHGFRANAISLVITVADADDVEAVTAARDRGRH